MRKLSVDEITIVPVEGEEDIVIVDLSSRPISEWCMELILLGHDLTDSISISDVKYSIDIYINNAQSSNCRSMLLSRDVNYLSLGITRRELRFWTNRFLKYYRDGIADVDHIDVDVEGNASIDQKGLCLVFKGMRCVEPVSAEEAAIRLGLWPAE